MTSLKDKIAVITGASSGIGKAIALDLAAKGVKTCLLGRNLETLEKVAGVARKTTSKVLCLQVDLVSDQGIRDISNCLQEELPCVDFLIHSAGTISFGPLETASVEDFDRQYQINVRAPYALTQILLPMLKSCQGQIVFINSSAGLNAGPNAGQYAATKFALKAIADSFRQEINADGLRVLSVYPGRTASPMQETIFKMEKKEYRPELLMQPEDVSAMVINALTLPRTAEITEINARPLIKSY